MKDILPLLDLPNACRDYIMSRRSVHFGVGASEIDHVLHVVPFGLNSWQIRLCLNRMKYLVFFLSNLRCKENS